MHSAISTLTGAELIPYIHYISGDVRCQVNVLAFSNTALTLDFSAYPDQVDVSPNAFLLKFMSK